MSVLKSRRRISPLNVLNSANILTDYSLSKVENLDKFPKSKQYIYARPIQKTCMKISSCIDEANEINVDSPYGNARELARMRYTHQVKALKNCKKLIEYIEQAYVHLPISGKEADYWIGLVDDVIKGIKSWQKSDIETYRKKFVKNKNG